MRFEEKDWDVLLPRIRGGYCTPFLGAAVNYGFLPLGCEIAETWALDHKFPLKYKDDLAKVAQYLAVTRADYTYPKELILKKLDADQKPFDFNDDSEPLNVLAKLPFPVYVTTNYDHLLYTAVEHHGRSLGREPAFELCKWNNSSKLQPNLFKRGSKFRPTAQTPVIYHLHGHRSVVDSIVLTEDDYLDFLVSMSNDINKFLPARIQEAITGSSVMFIGYSLADIDFRVLFRGLQSNLPAALKKLSITVQLPYEDASPNKHAAEDYISRYFGDGMRVYWGTAKEFARDLWFRWKSFND